MYTEHNFQSHHENVFVYNIAPKTNVGKTSIDIPVEREILKKFISTKNHTAYFDCLQQHKPNNRKIYEGVGEWNGCRINESGCER